MATDYAVTVAGSSRAVTGRGGEWIGGHPEAGVGGDVSPNGDAELHGADDIERATGRGRHGRQAALTNHTVTNGTAAPTLTTAAVDGAVADTDLQRGIGRGFRAIGRRTMHGNGGGIVAGGDWRWT